MRNMENARPIPAGIALRRRTQKGQELMEFGLIFGLVLAPLFLGMIVYGMNLIVSNQVNFFCREIGSIHIGGADLSTAATQASVASLAGALNLQVGSSGGAANTGNGGSGLVTITQFTYVGTTSQTSCSGVSTCNAQSFVYIQRIKFGNGSLTTAPASVAGDPSGATIDSKGIVNNPFGDPLAKLPTSAQSAMSALWKPATTGGIQDGQTVYLVETYFESTGFSFGKGTQGVYAKFFF